MKGQYRRLVFYYFPAGLVMQHGAYRSKLKEAANTFRIRSPSNGHVLNNSYEGGPRNLVSEQLVQLFDDESRKASRFRVAAHQNGSIRANWHVLQLLL